MESKYPDLVELICKHYLTGKKAKKGDWRVCEYLKGIQIFYKDYLIADVCGVSVFIYDTAKNHGLDEDELRMAVWRGTPIMNYHDIPAYVCYNSTMHKFGITMRESRAILDHNKVVKAKSLEEAQKLADEYTNLLATASNIDVTPAGTSYMIVRS